MSWISENKFLTGFGAVMLAGVGTLGYFTYAAMDKSDSASNEYQTATAQLKRLQEAKPGLKDDSNRDSLLAQKKELSEKITAFKTKLKEMVLPPETISNAAFQDRLKDSVAQISARAAAANVERPKDFYLGFGVGFGDYQSKPPSEKAAPALARELRAIELVMNVLIRAGNIELETFERDPLPEEGATKAGKRRGSGEHGIERNTVRLKITTKDAELRSVLTALANHAIPPPKDDPAAKQKQPLPLQLFIIRNLAVQNKMQESPPRTGLADAPAGVSAPVAQTPAPIPGGASPATPVAPAPTAPAVPATAPAPAATAAPATPEGALSYVFGAEKITATIELEILNFEEPKAGSEKPEKSGKKKDK